LGKNSRRKSLRFLESGFLAAGVVLLAAYFILRGLGDYQARSDISVFEQAVASEAIGKPSSVKGNPAQGSEPDYSLWSEKRIQDYHESRKQRNDKPVAILSIDKLGLKVPVYNGTDEINLNRGAGRIKGTASISANGNLGIAGHRDGFFRVLKDVEVGDNIDMLTYKGKRKFVVSSIDIVDPSDVSVLAPTEDPTITLVTCYPFYFVGHAPKRYIVKGKLLSSQVNNS